MPIFAPQQYTLAPVLVIADQATSSSAFTAITGLSFPISDNSKYIVVCELWCSASGGGIKFAVTFPSLGTGFAKLVVDGMTTGITVFSNENITTTNSLSATTYIAGALSGRVRLTLGIQMIAGTPGTVQFGFSSPGSVSVSVLKGSSMKIFVAP